MKRPAVLLATAGLLAGVTYAAAAPAAMAAPVGPLVTVVNTVAPTIDATGLHFYGKTIPADVLETMSPTAVKSAEATMAGQQVAEPADDVGYTAVGALSDETIAALMQDGHDWVNATMLDPTGNYPSSRDPAEYSVGTGPNTPVADWGLAHDRTTDQWFQRYYPGLNWPNGSWIGTQYGYGGMGPAMLYNWNPARCAYAEDYCETLTASAQGLGPNEQTIIYCTAGQKHHFQLFMAEADHFTGAGFLYDMPGCPITFFQGIFENTADYYYSDVGIC